MERGCRHLVSCGNFSLQAQLFNRWVICSVSQQKNDKGLLLPHHVRVASSVQKIDNMSVLPEYEYVCMLFVLPF